MKIDFIADAEPIFYEDEYIRVFSNISESSEILLVMFSEMGFDSDKSSWGGKTAFSAGFSYLGFVSKYPNWFPLSSINRAQQLFIKLLADHRYVVTYGHSQGGYAAIRYASIFQASYVIAFCPQFSISPHEMDGLDERFCKFFINKYEHSSINSSNVEESSFVSVFYDPQYKLDALNFSYIKNEINLVHGFKIFGTGHNTIRPFSGASTLRALVMSVIDRDVIAIRKLARFSKNNWSARKIYLARSIARRNPLLAIDLIKNSTELNSEVVPDLVKSLHSLGYSKYIADNANYFLGYMPSGAPNYVLESMVASGDYSSAFNFILYDDFFKGRDLFKYSQLLNGSFNDEFNSFPSDLISFSEGWHDVEAWGVWGKSVRSRVFLDFSKISIDSCYVQIPVELFSPSKQKMRVELISCGEVSHVNVNDNLIEVDCSSGRVVLIFYIDAIYSPLHLNVSSDERLLGVKLHSYREWIFK